LEEEEEEEEWKEGGREYGAEECVLMRDNGDRERTRLQNLSLSLCLMRK
jgi:hypothetical protein